MEKMVCSFTGHRDIAKDKYMDIKKRTEKIVDKLISMGVNSFITGGAVGYDMLAAEVVISAKEYANVSLTLAIPCKDQEKYYCSIDKRRYEKILKKADKIEILSDKYYMGCMQTRNRFMVDNSHYVVSFCEKSAGGTYYTKRYAEKQGKYVIECSLVDL